MTDEAQALSFGDVVSVTRGSEQISPGMPGCLRTVVGVYLRQIGEHQHFVRLLEDDKLATNGYCTHRGDKGTWTRVRALGTHCDPPFCMRCDGDGFVMRDCGNGGDYEAVECPVCKGSGRGGTT